MCWGLRAGEEHDRASGVTLEQVPGAPWGREGGPALSRGWWKASARKQVISHMQSHAPRFPVGRARCPQGRAPGGAAVS